MKLRISSILGLGCVAQLAHASILFPFVFDEVAVFNYPNWNTQDPRDRTMEGENFFCYATEKGYLSFGWYDASPETDYSQCRANSLDYIWYEYSEKIQCTEMGCKAHIHNYWAGSNTLKFKTDYVFRDSSLVCPELGNMSTIYRDEEQGPSAVGTRRVLSSPCTTLECCQALKTFRKVRGSGQKLMVAMASDSVGQARGVSLCPKEHARWPWLPTARHKLFSARAARVKVH